MIAIVACIVFVGGTILASYLLLPGLLHQPAPAKIESDTFAREFFGTTKPAELAKISDYSFASEDATRKGIASIPIDKAMQNVIDRYGKK
jgi:hypothetical protein